MSKHEKEQKEDGGTLHKVELSEKVGLKPVMGNRKGDRGEELQEAIFKLIEEKNCTVEDVTYMIMILDNVRVQGMVSRNIMEMIKAQKELAEKIKEAKDGKN